MAGPLDGIVRVLDLSERSPANYPVCGELIEAQYGMQHFQEGVQIFRISGDEASPRYAELLLVR